MGLTDRGVQVCLKELVLGQLAFPVGRKPDLGQGTLLGEDGFGIEHYVKCVEIRERVRMKL